MTTRLHLCCDGCGDQIHTQSIRKGFIKMAGDFYACTAPDIDAVVEQAAPGWVWCDPYTRCTYCPACWAEIVGARE